MLIFFHQKNVKQILYLFRDTPTFIPFNEDYELIPYQLPIEKPSDHASPLSHRENEVNFVFQFDFLLPYFFSHITAAIDRSNCKSFIGKLKPVYYYSIIVFNNDHFKKK